MFGVFDIQPDENNTFSLKYLHTDPKDGINTNTNKTFFIE
jgi:hypothetical protein